MQGCVPITKNCSHYSCPRLSIILFYSNNLTLRKMNDYSFVSRWNRFEFLIATFRLRYCNTARSIVYVSLFVTRWFSAIGAFRSSLLFQLLDVVPS